MRSCCCLHSTQKFLLWHEPCVDSEPALRMSVGSNIKVVNVVHDAPERHHLFSHPARPLLLLAVSPVLSGP
jgi:hypothetical protein